MYNAVESENGVFVMRSQVHGGFVVPCAMKRRLGPDFKQDFQSVSTLFTGGTVLAFLPSASWNEKIKRASCQVITRMDVQTIRRSRRLPDAKLSALTLACFS
jgi:hypothetical protein